VIGAGLRGLACAAVAENDLQRLVRRRLWELGETVEEVARRARWVLPAETITRMARRGGRSFISEGLARHLARGLRVPENRVRRAAGLPLVDDPRADITTSPHLRLVGRDD
jgi:hypothetical protein